MGCLFFVYHSVSFVFSNSLIYCERFFDLLLAFQCLKSERMKKAVKKIGKSLVK